MGAALLERAGQVFRRGGLRGLWLAALSRTVYRRAVLIEHPLDEAVTRAASTAPVTVCTLDGRDADAYAAFRPDTSAGEVRRRLAAGEHCFAARHEGRIVSAAWVTVGRARVAYLGCALRLAPDEGYLYDSFTTPEFRGRSVPALRAAHEARELRARGCRRLIAVVVPENAAALRHAEKSGWRPIGMLRAVGIGSWRRSWCRVSAGARPPGAPGGGRRARAARGSASA